MDGRGNRATPEAKYPWLKPGVLIGSLIPLGLLVTDALRDTLGADPVAIALNRLGLLALTLLVASLAATPLRIWFDLTWPMRIRQLLGLLAFFYASLHMLVYALVDQGLSLGAIAEDVLERKFITAGFAAFLLLVPLALTSTARMRRRLGGRRWQRLHRLVYPAALLALLHFIWRVKQDLSQPLAYALVLAVLLLARLLLVQRRRAAAARG